MSQKTQLQTLILIKQRRLNKLKEKVAVYGKAADPSMEIEIEDIEHELADLKIQLEQVATLPGYIHPLPLPPRHFTGCRDLLDKLSKMLARPDGRFVALQGMGGSGKTVLAQKIAERMQSHFTAGIFWADMPKTGGNIVSILHGWSRMLELALPGEQEAAGLVQAMRGLLAGQQAENNGFLLIVIDDVRPEWLENAQLLRQVLPPGASLLLTTRDRELALAMDVDVVEPLETFDRSDGFTLLQKYTGKTTLETSRDAVNELLAELGDLPLAIRLAGEWLAQSAWKYKTPQRLVAQLIKEISGQKRVSGWALKKQPELAAVFEISFNPLSPELQQMFRATGVFASEALRIERMAGLLGIAVDEAEFMLDELVNKALLNQGEPTEDISFTYTIHPLLKEYAARLLAKSNELEAVQRAYMAHYLALAKTYNQNTPEAHNQLEVELADLLNAAHIAAALGEYQIVSDFGLALVEKSEFLFVRGHFREAAILFEYVTQENFAKDDLNLQLTYHKNLGRAYLGQGDLKEAESSYLQGIEYCDQFERGGLLTCDFRQQLAGFYAFQGRYQEARTLVEKNLAICSHLEDNVAAKKIAARGYQIQGQLSIYQNQFEAAEEYTKKSLDLYNELKDERGKATTLLDLGIILSDRELNLDEARECFRQSLAYWQRTGNLTSQAHVLVEVSRLERKQKWLEAALQTINRAYEISQKIGDASLQAVSIIQRGHIYLDSHQRELACKEWRMALKILQDHQPHWREQVEMFINENCAD